MTEKIDQAADESPYYLIQSVSKALSILQCFIEEHRSLGITEIARKLKLNKSVVHRLVLTMQDHGYLKQVKETDKYEIGPRAFELGAAFSSSSNLLDEGRKILTQVVEQIELTAHLAVLDKDMVLYLINLEPDHMKYLYGAVGQRRQIYNSSLGKSLTAWLPEEQLMPLIENYTFEKVTENTIDSREGFLQELARVRQLGFAVDNEEQSFGMRCVGAPIRHKSGEVIAAISVSGYGVAEERLTEIGIAMKSFAAQLSRRIGNYNNL